MICTISVFEYVYHAHLMRLKLIFCCVIVLWMILSLLRFLMELWNLVTDWMLLINL